MHKSQAATANIATPLRPEDVRGALHRIDSSPVFADARRLRDFLHYVVEESLAGRADRIKGFTVAQDVFQLSDPEDARTSTIVRVEAGRLRRRLIEYYAAEGRNDPLRIDIPKGGYAPSFIASEGLPEHTRNEADPGARVTRSIITGRRVVIAGVVLIALVALWISLGLWASSTGSDSGVASSYVRPTIAVLPFEDETGDGTAHALSLGLTEDIVTDLSKVSGIDVIALSSVAMLSDSDTDPTSVRNALGVTHVLRGSVRGIAPNFRVTAQLIDARTRRQLWAERFDRDIDVLFDVQDELSGHVVQGLSMSLSGRRTGESVRINPVADEARSLYRQGIDLVNPPGNPSRLVIAREAFSRAVEADPNYASAYAGLAYTHVFDVLFEHSTDPDADLHAAVSMANHALQLDPTTGLAYMTLAFAELAMTNFDDAVRLSQLAVDTQPSEPYLNAYHAFILTVDGRAEDALPYAERALRLDPLTVRAPFLNILGFVSFYAGDYRHAVNAYEENRRRGGPYMNGHQAHVVAANVGLGRVGDAREGLRALQESGAGDGTDSPLLRLFRRPEDRDHFMALLREAYR